MARVIRDEEPVRLGALKLRNRIVMSPAFAAIIIIVLLSWFVVDLIIANVGHVVARAPVYERNLREVTNRAAAWLGAEEGTRFLYYSVEHTPESIHKKLASDFDWFRTGAQITAMPREIPSKHSTPFICF